MAVHARALVREGKTTHRWLVATNANEVQLPDGSIQMQFPTNPDILIPHLNPRKDTGPHVLALLQLPPASTLMAASEWLTWPDWIKLFGDITDTKTSYKQTSVQDMDEYLPGGAGKEIGEMYQFSSKLGYNAKQERTLMKWDLEKVCSAMACIIFGIEVANKRVDGN